MSKHVIHACFSYVGGIFAYWLGGYDLVLKTMLALTSIDFITGVGNAWKSKQLSARICADGIIRKIYMYITVALAVIVQNFVGNTIPIREMVIVFYIVSEGLSCLENIGKVIKYPAKLKAIFTQLNEKYE